MLYELAVDVLRVPVGEGRCQPSRGRRALPPVAACGENLLEVFGSSGHDFLP